MVINGTENGNNHDLRGVWSKAGGSLGTSGRNFVATAFNFVMQFEISTFSKICSQSIGTFLGFPTKVIQIDSEAIIGEVVNFVTSICSPAITIARHPRYHA